MKLSEYFTLEEMTFSPTAVKMAIDNSPEMQYEENLRKLCTNVLDPIRAHFGIIHVNSGYRCPELNKQLLGAKNSQHLFGQAADIIIKPHSVEDVYLWIKSSGIIFDQLIQEFNSWVHVSFASGNRGECLRAVKVNGNTIYNPD